MKWIDDRRETERASERVNECKKTQLESVEKQWTYQFYLENIEQTSN